MLSNERTCLADFLPLLQCGRNDGTAHLITTAATNQYQSIMDAGPRKDHSCPMTLNPGGSITERLLVSLVDDDESIRESLPDLLREFGFASRAFSSGSEFLSSEYVDVSRCLILDMVMPGMTGLEVQEELRRRGRKIPIIFITAKKDEAIRAKAIENGAVKCLYKPFSEMALLDALKTALKAD
jgi:CheY-like chemotaxis protein